jgi:hypothetical protein
MGAAVKFLDGSDDTIEILAIPFSGPFAGKDADGEFFSLNTDLCPGWFPDALPLLYHHALDDTVGTEVIGRVDVKSLRTDDEGHWVKAQLDKRSKYLTQIKKLIEQEALGASSGAMSHLVKRTKAGEITRWPWVELSLTPTPCNPYAVVSYDTAAKHYKSLDLELPDEASLADTATKAAGAVIPAEGQSEGSHEDLAADLTERLNGRLMAGRVAGLPPVGYAYPVATFDAGGAHLPGYCVVRFSAYDQATDDDDQPAYYRVDFAIGDDGEPVLGAASPLAQVYVPYAADAAKALNTVPLALAADEAVRFAAGVQRQAEAVAARRRADKREMSAPNVARLKALATELRSQADALDALTAPLPAEADELAARRIEARLKLLHLAAIEA